MSLAVVSLAAARAELDRLGIRYRCLPPDEHTTGERLVLLDPAGVALELREARSDLPGTGGAPDYARVSCTVLFADMRGFTALAERLGPDQVVPLLNDFLALLTGITADHDGTVFHVAGDGLMAGFGVPGQSADASTRAVTAARRMLAGFDALASDWKHSFNVDTGLGIGINAGEVIAGDIGGPQRASFTLIGDTVNVAARLVQRARAGEALISRAVWQALDAELQRAMFVALPPLALRGRLQPVEIFCLPATGRKPWVQAPECT
ncbi:MAG: adenylate/guanylate cyclase domain-containing protein [Gammaproteobacteria bacterium]|nr:adenylate/guanylate cyclase domain-containing protein [Gammaproteobacteria bacterium]